MASTILNALLPIVITLLLGVAAAWHHDFDETQASVLNRMVMIYALPLVLVAGIVATPRAQLAGDATLILIVFAGLLASFFVPLVLAHWVFRRDLMTSTLQALSIGGPSVAFVGLPVLGYLFGPTAATIPVAISALVLTLVQVPITMIILASCAAARGEVSGKPVTVGSNIAAALKQPMVWAPVLGFIVMVAGIPIPEPIRQSMALLGHATGGVALFASGIILFSRRVVLSLPVAVSSISRNIIVPAVVWGLISMFGVAPQTGNVAVLTMAIPTAVVGVILAVQYHTAEQEMASTLFFSTIMSLPTMGAFIWLLGA